VARLLRRFPDYLTQGESLSELEENLRDLYKDLTSGEILGIRKVAELSIGWSLLISSASSNRLAASLVRHGGKHDWVSHPKTGVAQPVPRHSENRNTSRSTS
jgi:hypothetical protein